MYAWKCWRDTQLSLLAFSGGLLLAYLFYWAMVRDWFGWGPEGALGFVRPVWLQAADMTVRLATLLMPLIGFIIGSEGIAHDFRAKNLTYLLSRPRARAFFLLLSWAMGAAQIVLLMLVAGLLDRLKPSMDSFPKLAFTQLPMLKIILAVTVVALAIHSFTFMCSIVLRSGRMGARVAFAVCFVGMMVADFDAQNLSALSPVTFVREVAIAAAFPQKHAFPVLLAAMWTAVSLAMVAVSCWSFLRYEPKD